MKSVAITYKEPINLTRNQLTEIYGDELTFLGGFDDCIVGVVENRLGKTVVCYDKCKVIDKMMKSGMSIDDAEEFCNYNSSLWMGDLTPCFIIRLNGK